MIQAERGPEPDGFAARSADWQKRFAEAQNQNPNLTPAEFWSRVRRELRTDAEMLYAVFHGKCAFCESRMAHVSSPHIEHYRPKMRYPQYMFTWANWLLSCGRCNDMKWAHFPDCDGEPCLLDPVAENPGIHLDFLGAQILHKTRRGKETIKLVGLDRGPLTEQRASWLMNINILLLLVCCVPEAYSEARELLIWAMQPDAPYAAMIRSYLRHKTPQLANPERPHPFIQPHGQLKRLTDLIEKYNAQLSNLI